MARAADAGSVALAVTVFILLAGCGSSGHNPDKPRVASKQHHITGPTHPGGNGTKGE